MRVKKIWLNKLLIIVLSFVFYACSLYGNNIAPYLIKGEMTLDKSDGDFDAAGINLLFKNRSEKTVSEFTIVFYLFDENGEPVSSGRSNIVFSVKTEINPNDSFECCVSLDKYLGEFPEESYQIEYLYVSRILYTDNSIWTDAFGTFSN